MPLDHGVAAPNIRHHDAKFPRMVLVRATTGVDIDLSESFGHLEPDAPVQAFIFLVSPERHLGRHLRSVAQIATTVDSPEFLERWLACESDAEMRALLLRDERFIQFIVQEDGTAAELIGRRLNESSLPPGALVALVHREEAAFVPTGDEVLKEGDRLTIIGNPNAIDSLRQRFELP